MMTRGLKLYNHIVETLKNNDIKLEEGIRLKASYAIELGKDRKALHGSSAQKELSEIMAKEIKREIFIELDKKKTKSAKKFKWKK